MGRVIGQTFTEFSRDEAGHRMYQVNTLVQADPEIDGPYTILNTEGVPSVGDVWQFNHEQDIWATCRAECRITPHQRAEDPALYYLVTNNFSTKPPDINRCQQNTVTEPLLIEPEVSGNFVKYQQEIQYDRFGNPLKNSAHERIKGPLVTFDKNRCTVRITQNVASFEQAFQVPAYMMDTLNQYPIWGFPPRCVKLSSGTWERKFYGQCYVYYRRTLEFDISVETDGAGSLFGTFDRDAQDEATMVLGGRGSTWIVDGVTGQFTWHAKSILGITTTPNPDPDNPLHFVRAKDPEGNPKVQVLNGRGIPSGSTIISPSPTTVLPQQGMVMGSYLPPPSELLGIVLGPISDFPPLISTGTYVVTAVNAGGETTGTSITLTTSRYNDIVSGHNTVNLIWDAVPGATSYKVYRTRCPEQLASTALLPTFGTGVIGTETGTNFVDDGTSVPNGAFPPTVNTALVPSSITPDAQPPNPTRLRVTFTLVPGRLAPPSGIIEIAGIGDRGASIVWSFNFTTLLQNQLTPTPGSTVKQDTPQTFTTVTSISFRELVNTGIIRVKIQTLTEIAQTGTIHIEGYGESDFTLLSIPLSF